MATLREQVPRSAQGPISVFSLVLGIAGFTLGYIVSLLGITLYYDLNGFGEEITAMESLVVVVLGVVSLVLGYLGWRGFMYFAY